MQQLNKTTDSNKVGLEIAFDLLILFVLFLFFLFETLKKCIYI